MKKPKPLNKVMQYVSDVITNNQPTDNIVDYIKTHGDKECSNIVYTVDYLNITYQNNNDIATVCIVTCAVNHPIVLLKVKYNTTTNELLIHKPAYSLANVLSLYNQDITYRVLSSLLPKSYHDYLITILPKYNEKTNARANTN